MSGLYSLGKKRLEQETAKPDVSVLEKSKEIFQVYLNELSRTESLTDNPKWISAVTESIQKTLRDYEACKQDLTRQIEEANQKAQLQDSIVALLRKSNSLDETFTEIKEVLSQIFRVVTADAELKRRTLENINAELAK